MLIVLMFDFFVQHKDELHIQQNEHLSVDYLICAVSVFFQDATESTKLQPSKQT